MEGNIQDIWAVLGFGEIWSLAFWLRVSSEHLKNLHIWVTELKLRPGAYLKGLKIQPNGYPVSKTSNIYLSVTLNFTG